MNEYGGGGYFSLHTPPLFRSINQLLPSLWLESGDRLPMIC